MGIGVESKKKCPNCGELMVLRNDDKKRPPELELCRYKCPKCQTWYPRAVIEPGWISRETIIDSEG